MTPNHRTNENSDTVNLLVVLGKKDILFFFLQLTAFPVPLVPPSPQNTPVLRISLRAFSYVFPFSFSP